MTAAEIRAAGRVLAELSRAHARFIPLRAINAAIEIGNPRLLLQRSTALALHDAVPETGPAIRSEPGRSIVEATMTAVRRQLIAMRRERASES